MRLSGGFAALPLLQACGGGGGQDVSAGNNYTLATLVANRASYSPLILEPGLVNAIDFGMKVLKLSFHDTMREIIHP